MLSSLRATPFVVPESEERVPLLVRPRPDGEKIWAVRLKRPGFLSDADLAKLGVHSYEVTVVPPPLYPLPLIA